LSFRLSVSKARKDERASTNEIHNIIANYGDVIPKIDFNNLKAKHSELQKQVEDKTKEFNSLKAEHE
jgi:hypothetical protein